MIAYLDTNVAAWLAAGRSRKISKDAERILRSAELFLSPMVLLELEYIYDLGRSKLRSRAVQLKLQAELPIRVCDLSFAQVADAAIEEGWTNDPFDRLIVANAKANRFAILLTADEKIATHYPNAVW